MRQFLWCSGGGRVKLGFIKYFLINGQSLKLSSDAIEADEVISGKLIDANGKEFLIKAGIPRFVNNLVYSDDDVKQTSDSFGVKWNESKYSELSEKERLFFEEQMMAILGCYCGEDLENLFKDKEFCLNAGCGMAWSERYFNVNPKTKRFACDISDSVEMAYQNTKGMDNVLVCQADIFDLPFPEDFFDVIFSNGVLHHTPDARQAFVSLCKHLKAGGIIGVYIYCLKPFIREIVDREVRKITTELEYKECREFSCQMALLGESLQQYQTPIAIEEDIPILGIKKGTYNLQKFIYDHFIKCFFNSSLGLEASTLVNIDWYHPKYASHHSLAEIKSWFDEGGIQISKVIQPKGWEYSGYFVSGTKKRK